MKGARAEIAVELVSRRHALAIYQALAPETKHSIGPRSKITIRLRGKSLQLTASAKDISALRAAINSYLRWVTGSADLIRIADESKLEDTVKCSRSTRTAYRELGTRG